MKSGYVKVGSEVWGLLDIKTEARRLGGSCRWSQDDAQQVAGWPVGQTGETDSSKTSHGSADKSQPRFSEPTNLRTVLKDT